MLNWKEQSSKVSYLSRVRYKTAPSSTILYSKELLVIVSYIYSAFINRKLLSDKSEIRLYPKFRNLTDQLFNTMGSHPV